MHYHHRHIQVSTRNMTVHYPATRSRKSILALAASEPFVRQKLLRRIYQMADTLGKLKLRAAFPNDLNRKLPFNIDCLQLVFARSDVDTKLLLNKALATTFCSSVKPAVDLESSRLKWTWTHEGWWTTFMDKRQSRELMIRCPTYLDEGMLYVVDTIRKHTDGTWRRKESCIITDDEKSFLLYTDDGEPRRSYTEDHTGRQV